MKFSIYCTLLVAFALIRVNGHALIGKTRNAGGTRIGMSRNNPPTSCTEAGPKCTEDCSTLLLCSALKSTPLKETPCTAPNRYCVNGACASNPGTVKCSIGGASAGSNFECTEAGIFPDPLDCAQYHICDAQGASVFYQCDPGFVFNSQLKICQIGRTPCTKIVCSRDKDVNTFMAYTSNPAYYAYCSKDTAGAYEILMFKCPYEEFEAFHPKTNECKFKCKAKGNYQNPSNCGEYFYCSGVNAQPILGRCPTNWVFDGSGCNPNANKCQHKPDTSNSDQYDLSTEIDADSVIDILVAEVKGEIIQRICAANTPIPVCADQSNQSTITLAAKKFRTQTDNDGSIYFVSLSVDTSLNMDSAFFHVSIKKPQTGNAEVRNIKKSTKDDDPIVYFDADDL